jgi:hypothetical protein
MTVKLRRIIIAARLRSPRPEQVTPQGTRAVLAAWAAAGTSAILRRTNPRSRIDRPAGVRSSRAGVRPGRSGAIVLPWGSWWVRWGIVGVLVAVIAACLIILPPIRYRVFWYAISSTEIDIQNGIIFIHRSVVPMRRVQTLFSERGPIADHYRLIR